MANMQLLTVTQVAELSVVSEDTVRAWIRGKKLKAINIGSDARPIYRVRACHLEAFLTAFESHAVTEDVIKPARPRARKAA
jgi:excisionase family DNA binding protein